MKLFDENKPLYKGNLHTHTTNSDGRKTPEEAIAYYRSLGYDFVALSDHFHYHPTVNGDDFVIVAAAEYNVNDAPRTYHILALGLDANIDADDRTPPQEIIDKIREKNGMAVIAHPAWSLMTAAEMMELTGWEATEIYNGISDTYANRGFSTEIVDTLGSRGCTPLLLSTDDAHFYDYDSGLGFIVVQPDAFTAEGILAAIRAGRFYASTGPRIYQLTVENGVITVETSGLERLTFMSNTWWNPHRTVRSENGTPLTRAAYEISPTDKWVRIEGFDRSGRYVFSNFINVDNL